MRYIVLLAGALLTAGLALAAPYAFTPLPPLFFMANAINDLGQVGGEAQTSLSLGAQGRAAIASNGVTTFVPAPFSNFTVVTGLNNAGDYVGTLSFGTTSAFAMFGGVAVALATPPNPGGNIQPNGITTSGRWPARPARTPPRRTVSLAPRWGRVSCRRTASMPR